jgi:hypothetical protein
MEPLAKGAASAIIAYTAHYGTAKLYNYFCIPDGVWGYVQGYITAGSPICRAGMEIMVSSQLSFNTVIMVGMTRIVLDWVAPGSQGTQGMQGSQGSQSR